MGPSAKRPRRARCGRTRSTRRCLFATLERGRAHSLLKPSTLARREDVSSGLAKRIHIHIYIYIHMSIEDHTWVCHLGVSFVEGTLFGGFEWGKPPFSGFPKKQSLPADLEGILVNQVIVGCMLLRTVGWLK